MSKQVREVAIIGGGIAGPVTALALHKAGIEATVYESHPSTADGLASLSTVCVSAPVPQPTSSQRLPPGRFSHRKNSRATCRLQRPMNAS